MYVYNTILLFVFCCKKIKGSPCLKVKGCQRNGAHKNWMFNIIEIFITVIYHRISVIMSLHSFVVLLFDRPYFVDCFLSHIQTLNIGKYG